MNNFSKAFCFAGCGRLQAARLSECAECIQCANPVFLLAQVVTQALFSCEKASFKAHLAGIFAGLLHVFLPKSGETSASYPLWYGLC